MSSVYLCYLIPLSPSLSHSLIDVIMDMLGSEESRIAILNFYNGVKESDRVNDAIKSVRDSVAESYLDNTKKIRYRLTRA